MNNYFNMQNTEGYSQSDLDSLNAKLQTILDEEKLDISSGEYLDRIDQISERLLTDWDTQHNEIN